MFTLKCTCGKLVAPDNTYRHQEDAGRAAMEHARLGKGHNVTGTRPAHNHPNGVPVIVFEVFQNKSGGLNVITEP